MKTGGQVNRLKIIVAICGCFLLTTYISANAADKKGDTKANAKKAVLKNLKDPDSAKFGEYTQIDAKFACLTVNARNSYGGYTGDRQAFLGKLGKDWFVLDIHEVSHGRCITILKKTSVEEGYKAEYNDNHEQIHYAEPIYLDCTVSFDPKKPIPKNKNKRGYELGKTLNELIGHKNSFQIKIDAKTGEIIHTGEPETLFALKEFDSQGVVNSKYIRYMHSYDYMGDTLNDYYEINRNNLSVKQTSYIESSNNDAFYEIMEKKGNCKASTANESDADSTGKHE